MNNELNDSFNSNALIHSMSASGFGCRKSTAWVAISLLFCTNGLRKQFSGHVRPLFPALKLSFQSLQAAIGQEL